MSEAAVAVEAKVSLVRVRPGQPPCRDEATIRCHDIPLKNSAKYGRYERYGSVLKPSRLLPVKMPHSFRRGDGPEGQWSPEDLLRQWPAVGGILDLTNHAGDSSYVLPEGCGVDRLKLPLESKVIPSDDYIAAFCWVVDGWLEANPTKLLAVHCHYSFNRTGYCCVKYLHDRLGLSVPAALAAFVRARPPGIRHDWFKRRLLKQDQGDGAGANAAGGASASRTPRACEGGSDEDGDESPAADPEAGPAPEKPEGAV